MHMQWRRTGALSLEAVAVAGIAVGFAVVASGPFRLGSDGIALRVGTPWRALSIGLLALTARIGLVWRGGSHDRGATAAGSVFRVTCAAILALDALLVFTRFAATCGGLDSAGYLGEMTLLLKGRLTEYQPIAGVLASLGGVAAAAPLGFVPAAQPLTIAPRFPPGLPLVMAAFRTVGGPRAPFLVAPVLGCAAVALAAANVRRRHDLSIAMLAAVLVATNPIFLYMSLQPMSDVPAAFWLLLAAFALWRPQPAAIAGGAAAGMALLTRPPLLPAIAAIGLVTRWRSRREATAFTATVGLFLILFALWLVRLYGSPFSSGYGTPAQLFTASTIRQNVTNHIRWLLVANTPLLPVAFAAAWRRDRFLTLAAALIFAGVFAPYLLYASIFDDWEILRFLLPALAFVFAVCAIGVAAIVRLAFSAGSVRDAVALTGVAIVVTIGTLMFLQRRDAFDLWQVEMRYRMVGEWFAAKTPANAVAIASLHSGSLRYYSGRATLLMDALPAGRLGEIVSTLRRNGYDPYAVLEQGDELSTYLGRFRPDGIPGLESDVLTRIRGVYVVHLSE